MNSNTIASSKGYSNDTSKKRKDNNIYYSLLFALVIEEDLLECEFS